MAEGSQVELVYRVETTPGVTPGSGDWNRIRKNNESLKGVIGSIESGEIRSDRESASDIQGNKNVGGDIATELSGVSHDKLYESALYSTFTTTDSGATTLDAVATGNKITRASGSFVTDGFVVGQWALIAGFSTGANNGWAKITSVVALELVFSGITFQDESGGGDEQVSARYMKGGVTPIHLSIAKRFLDINQEMIFAGCTVGTLAMSIAPEAAISTTFTMNGRSESAVTTLGTTGVDLATTDPMASFSGKVLLDDVENTNITQFDFNIANNIADGFVIGNRFKTNQFAGRRIVSGNISFYFDNLDEYEDSTSHTTKDLAISMIEGTSYFGITFPRAYYDLETPAAGDEGPLVLTGPFRAKYDSTDTASVILSVQL